MIVRCLLIFVSFWQACVVRFRGRGLRDRWGLGLFLREIGHAKIRLSDSRVQSSADGGSGLLGTSVQVVAGWFHPDEQHVPCDMFTGSCGASAGEDLIE